MIHCGVNLFELNATMKVAVFFNKWIGNVDRAARLSATALTCTLLLITLNRDLTMSGLVITVSVRPVSMATRLVVRSVGLSPIKLGPRARPLNRDLFLPIQKGITP